MKRQIRPWSIMTILIAVAILVLAACATPQAEAPQPTPEPIVVTRIVEVQGETVVEEVVITATPEPEAEEQVEEEAPPPDEADLIPEVHIVAPSAGYDPARWEAALLMSAAWQELGFEVQLEGFPDFSTLDNVANSEPFDWDAFVSGFVSRPTRLDPDELIYRPFHCSGIENQGPNYVGYCNPEYDAVIEAQRSALDLETRQEHVYEAQRIHAEEVPTITLFHRQEVFAYNQELFENWTPVVGRGLWNIWNLISVTPTGDERTLRVGWATDIATTNPLALDSAIESLAWTYDTLAQIGPDGVPVPWAAESWTVVDDTTVDVLLRDDLMFHDGEPVTVEDVKFSYEFIAEFGTAGFFPAALSPIEEIEIVDDRTLRFHLVEPFAPLFYTTFTQIYILPQHIWEGVTEREGLESPDQWENATPIGSGPFQLMYHRRGEEILLQANPNHFNAPQVDGVLIVAHASTDAVFASLADGSVHMPDRGINPLNIPTAEDTPHLGLLDVRDFGVFYMGFNFRRPPFNDLVVRQALAHTLDHQTVVEAVLGGFGEPGQGMVAPANEYWYNPEWETWLAEDYNFDLNRARQILADAGYRWDAEGNIYYPPGGPPVPAE